MRRLRPSPGSGIDHAADADLNGSRNMQKNSSTSHGALRKNCVDEPRAARAPAAAARSARSPSSTPTTRADRHREEADHEVEREAARSSGVHFRSWRRSPDAPAARLRLARSRPPSSSEPRPSATPCQRDERSARRLACGAMRNGSSTSRCRNAGCARVIPARYPGTRSAALPATASPQTSNADQRDSRRSAARSSSPARSSSSDQIWFDT